MTMILQLAIVCLLLVKSAECRFGRLRREITQNLNADGNSALSWDYEACQKSSVPYFPPYINFNQSPTNVSSHLASAVNTIGVHSMSVINCSRITNGVFADMWNVISHYMQSGSYPIAEAVGEVERQTQDEGPVMPLLNFGKDLLGIKSTPVKDLVIRNIFSKFESTRTICDNYAKLCAKLSDALKKGVNPDETLKVQMKSQLFKCYQSLMKSSQMFDYPEHAASIYVAKVQADLLIITFLSDAAYFGSIIGIDNATINNYYGQLVVKLRNSFDFLGNYVHQRIASLNGNKNLTAIEYEVVKEHRRIVWFDKLLFPYGVPSTIPFINNVAPLRIDDNSDKIGGVSHMLYLMTYDNTAEHLEPCDVADKQAFLNGIMGLANPSLPKFTNYRLKIDFLSPKTYEIRVWYYFEMSHYDLLEGEVKTNDQYYYPALSSIDGDNIDITFTNIKTEVADHTYKFEVTNLMLQSNDLILPILQRSYAPMQEYSTGVAAVSSLGFVDVLPNEGIPVEGTITFLQEPGKEVVYFYGFDLIVHDTI